MKVNAFGRKLILIIGDILCLVFATNLAMYFEWGLAWTGKADFHMELLPILIILMLIMFNVYGLFSLLRKRVTEIFLNLFVAILNTFIVALAFTFLARDFDYSRMVLLKSAFWAFVFLYIWQYAMHQWEVSQMPKQRTVLFAGADEQKYLSEKITKYSFTCELQAVCAGIEDPDWQEKINECRHVIIAAGISVAEREKIICYAKKNSKVVFIIPTFYEICCRNISLQKLDDLPLHQVSKFVLTGEQEVLKRTIDLVAAMFAGIFLLPVMLLASIAIKIDSAGPVLYSQERVGQFGKTFHIYKFRSMFNDAEAKTGPVLSCEGDARITRVGHFLRATRIDELPQFFNVLKGDMSIVGPRPERPIFVERYSEIKPEYAYRLNVKPGITGSAQIYGKYNTEAYEKLIYDLLYIQNFSVMYDLTLMLQTFGILLDKNATEGMKYCKKELDDF